MVLKKRHFINRTNIDIPLLDTRSSKMKLFSYKRDRRASTISNVDTNFPDFRSLNSKEVLKSISIFESSLRDKANHWSRSISTHYRHIKGKFQEKHSYKPISFENIVSFQSTVDLGVHIFHSGVVPVERQAVWPYLLEIFPLGITPAHKIELLFKIDAEYTALKHRWQSDPINSRTIFNLIYKDVDRTDRYIPYFKVPNDHPHFIKLFNVVATYISTDINDYSIYAQGFTDIISIFVVIFESESMAYYCLKKFMDDQLSIFKPETQAFPARCALLGSLIEILDPEFFRFLEANEASNMLFTYRWFLLNLKREFTFDQSVKVFETIIATRLLSAVQKTIPPLLSNNNECDITPQTTEYPEFPIGHNDSNETYITEAYKDIFTLFLAYQLLATYKREFMKKKVSMPEMCEYYSEVSGTHNFESILKGAKYLFSQYICENLSLEADKENDYVYI